MRETLWLPAADIPCRTVAVLSQACAEAVARQGFFTLALSGGSSPVALFRALRAAPHTLDWAHTRIFQVDERCVPQDNALSNFGMLRRELLDHVPVSAAFPMYESGDPHAAATAYAALLTTHAPNGLDCAVLGMGADGHTASLFPDSPLLDAVAPTAVAQRPDAVRLTLTLPVLNAARLALFYIPGTDKAPMLQKALDESLPALSQTAIPARHIQSSRVIWIMNEACRTDENRL